MHYRRRDFINLSFITAGAAMLTGFSVHKDQKNKPGHERAPGTDPSLHVDIIPIGLAERQTRIEKARRLMHEQDTRAMVLDAGTALEYFTGVSWWPSERTLVAIIPARGEPAFVCPAFEEPRLRELIKIGKKVFVWQEDESPFKQIALAFKDLDIQTGNIGIEEQMRFFILDGMRKAAPHFRFVSADPVTIPCRLIKSPAEIALMQKANDITVEAIKIGIRSLREGMLPDDCAKLVTKTHLQYGATPDFALILFGEASAFPHGNGKPKELAKGNIVLMDCGCRLEGYSSDITRTIVFGAEPTSRQMEIWNLEQKAQAAGFAAALPGAACEGVDAAARKVLTDAGFGPGYKLPGLPHRTGHGIGMDGHEWGNMIKGNKRPLQPGMCFSIEPTISIPGEFGIRLEDCVYMTEEGAKWFSTPALSVSEPFKNNL